MGSSSVSCIVYCPFHIKLSFYTNRRYIKDSHSEFRYFIPIQEYVMKILLQVGPTIMYLYQSIVEGYLLVLRSLDSQFRFVSLGFRRAGSRPESRGGITCRPGRSPQVLGEPLASVPGPSLCHLLGYTLFSTTP